VSAGFGNPPIKPPDRGKPPGAPKPEPDDLKVDAAASGAAGSARAGTPPGPPAFAGAGPAPGGAGEPPNGGGGRTLRTVDGAEPPDEPLPNTSAGVQLERELAEVDEIRVRNEDARSKTRVEERNTNKLADTEELNTNKLAVAEVERIKSDTKTTRHERYFFMGLAALGLLLTVVSSMVAGLTGQSLFFSGSGVGLVATGGSLRRLGVLTAAGRRKPCFLRGKQPGQGEAESGAGS
jgi:hypothetical protein